MVTDNNDDFENNEEISEFNPYENELSNSEEISEFNPYENELSNSEEISEFNPYGNELSNSEEISEIDKNNLSSQASIPNPDSFSFSENDNDRFNNADLLDDSQVDEVQEIIINSDDDDSFNNPDLLDDSHDSQTKEEQEKDLKETLDDNLMNGLTDNVTLDKVENFYERKISPKEAERSSEPKQFNKKLIIGIIAFFVCGALVFTFLMPSSKKNNNSDDKSKIASSPNLDNFEQLANPVKNNGSSPIRNNSDNKTQDSKKTSEEKKFRTEYDSNGDVIIPPIFVEEQKPTYNTVTTTQTGTGTTVEIPNTRNDSLQGKSINGIKGLTSTQNRYSTDYAQQVEKNVASTVNSNYLSSLPSKEEYMNNILNTYTQSNIAQNEYNVQNDQSGKNNFFTQGQDTDVSGKWLPLNTIWQGTIFEAVLTSELNTDIPGEIEARVAKNIYSSQDGRYLLIPQNSILYGTYNSSISYAQSRVQVGWHTLIRPDGYQINLGSMNATDPKGASGLKGSVNDHPFAYMKAIGLMSLFSIFNSEIESATGTSTTQTLVDLLTNTQKVTNDLGEKILDRALNIQPSIKIKAGTKISIVANQSFTLPPCEEIPVTQQYKRY